MNQPCRYTDLHDFGGEITNACGARGLDGAFPEAGVTLDQAGNMFGTTSTGGAYGWGMVWEITRTGTYRDLHDFGGTVINADGKPGRDGQYVDGAGVSFDAAGNMFGTTRQGGAHDTAPVTGGDGMVWEISRSGRYIDRHDFGGRVTNAEGGTSADGFYPDSAGVTFDAEGNMYGTTSLGGAYGEDFKIQRGFGIVWEITDRGRYIDLHDFGATVSHAAGGTGPDGYACVAPVRLDKVGNLYGTTTAGGIHTGATEGDGVVWELSRHRGYEVLHDFGGTVRYANGKTGPDGNAPYAGVTLDAAGNMYGTTIGGGAYHNARAGYGMVWEITASGSYLDLHDFGGTTINADGQPGPDGTGPYYGGVVIDSVGDLFGTAQAGGPYETSKVFGGILWEISRCGEYMDLFDFGGSVTDVNGGRCQNGQLIGNTVTLDREGNLLGTTVMGGPIGNGQGMVWKLETRFDPLPLVL